MAFDVPENDFIKLINKRDDKNQRLFEVMASKSINTDFIEFIFEQIARYNIKLS